jgi:hypothetical protein
VNWIVVAVLALVASAAAVLLVFSLYRRTDRPAKRRATATQTDTRLTQVGDLQAHHPPKVAGSELRTAQKRVADVEKIVEDLITVIGPSASTLLWSLRAARAKEEREGEGVGAPESLTAQIERLSAQIWAYETAAGHVAEPGPSSSGELANAVAPAEEQRESASFDPATGTEDDTVEPVTAPDGPAAVEVTPTLRPMYVDPAAHAGSPAVDLEVDTERPAHVGRDAEGSAPGDEARWLRFALTASDTNSREPASPMGTFEESQTLRSSNDPGEATATDASVSIELHRADDTPLVVDLSDRRSANANPSRTARPSSSR